MKQFLIQFTARVKKEDGYVWDNLERLVEAISFTSACSILYELTTDDWDFNSPHDFKNLNV